VTVRPFAVLWTREAKKMLAGISDRRVQEGILRRVDDLAVDPEKQGKPLLADLAGYRSVRAVGQRYRIIYKVERARVIVVVVALGLRRSGSGKDIYALAQKLVRLRLLGPM
jgi:mRNA interferase RelE/StbE